MAIGTRWLCRRPSTQAEEGVAEVDATGLAFAAPPPSLSACVEGYDNREAGEAEEEEAMLEAEEAIAEVEVEVPVETTWRGACDRILLFTQDVYALRSSSPTPHLKRGSCSPCL